MEHLANDAGIITGLFENEHCLAQRTVFETNKKVLTLKVNQLLVNSILSGAHAKMPYLV